MRKIVVLAVAYLLTGCATIICGSKQDVTFKSSPENAVVEVDGNYAGKTPQTVELERKKSHKVTLKLDGYKEHTFTLERKFNAWYIGNIVFGGIIGIVVDPITGAMYKLKPEDITTETAGTRTVKNKGPKDIFITVSLEHDAALEQVGQLEKE